MKYGIYFIIMFFLGGGFDDLFKNGDVNWDSMVYVLVLYSFFKLNLICRKLCKKGKVIIYYSISCMDIEYSLL